jgi:regulator of sigma E protease
MAAVAEAPNRPLEFTVEHPGSAQSIKLRVTPSAQEGFSVYGEQTNVGEIEGMLPVARAPFVGVSDPASAAGKAGLRTGDLLESINDKPVKTWEEVDGAYAAAAQGTVFHLVLQRPDKVNSTTVKADLTKGTAANPEEGWGLRSSELFVEKVQEGSPAQKAGVLDGDRLIGVGTKDVASFFDLKDAVQRAGESEGRVALRWEREGKVFNASIVPNAATTKDALLKNTTQYTVGVIPMLSNAEPITVLERTLNPIKLVYKATERMVIFSWRNFVSIRKMFTGDVSMKTLGGPIMIGKIAGESLSRGLIAFLTTMAILSIGLGVLNVLPVPVLDGGHLLLLALEAVRGKPLTMRQMEIIQGVGLSLILLLMVVAFHNDFMRLDLPSFPSIGK